MLRRFVLVAIVGGVFGWALGGCGQSDRTGSSSGPKDAKLVTITRGELSKVELGPYFPSDDPQIPGLDENRLKVAGPKGWQVGPRTGKALVWFKQSLQYDYPQILVTAEDFEQIMEVTSATASKFAQVLASNLRKKIPDVEVVPIRVGDRYGAMYRRMGPVKREFTEIDLESLIIETVVDGRKYAFELRTYPGQTEKYVHDLYAVFLMAKFLKGGGPSEQKPPAEPTPETPPAKPEIPPEKPKTEPTPEKPPSKPEPPSEKPKSEEKSSPEPKQPPKAKPPEEKPPSKPEPAEKPPEKPKKKKPLDFDIIE